MQIYKHWTHQKRIAARTVCHWIRPLFSFSPYVICHFCSQVFLFKFSRIFHLERVIFDQKFIFQKRSFSIKDSRLGLDQALPWELSAVNTWSKLNSFTPLLVVLILIVYSSSYELKLSYKERYHLKRVTRLFTRNKINTQQDHQNYPSRFSKYFKQILLKNAIIYKNVIIESLNRIQ